MQGRERKAFFNQISGAIVLGCGLAGALLGFSWGGLLGALLGLAVGIAGGGEFAEKQRFYRR